VILSTVLRATQGVCEDAFNRNLKFTPNDVKDTKFAYVSVLGAIDGLNNFLTNFHINTHNEDTMLKNLRGAVDDFRKKVYTMASNVG
jgi:hypothetical protein